MTVEDIEVQREVRAVIARNWVNTQRINYGATHGTLYIQGRLMLLHEPPSKPNEERDRHGVSASFLVHLERELLKVPGLRAIRWNIDGWTRSGTAAWLHR